MIFIFSIILETFLKMIRKSKKKKNKESATLGKWVNNLTDYRGSLHKNCLEWLKKSGYILY